MTCILHKNNYSILILDTRDPMLRSDTNDIRDRGRSGTSSQAKGYIDVSLYRIRKKVV